MQCPSCGFADQQNLDQCPRCGRVLAAPREPGEQQIAEGSPLAGSGNTAPSAEPAESSGSATSQAPYPPTNPYGQYGSYPPPSGYWQPYAPPGSQGYPVMPGYPPPPGYPPFQQAPQPQRKRRTGLIIGIIAAAVVVVLVACVGGAIFAIRSLGQPNAIRGLGTFTVASPTPAPTATATPVRTVIYQNTFASGAEGWSNSPGTCFWKSDGYHVTDNYECYAPAGVQTSVDISVDAKQLSGTTNTPYGIVFGLDDKQNDYSFMIISDSAWVLFRCTADSCTTPIDYTDDKAILGGLHTLNRLEVLVQGTHFEFYVNGTKVGSYDDPNYTSGRVGVTVGDSIECAFTNFVISRP